MSEVFKRPGNPVYYFYITDANGKTVRRSTKTTSKREAEKIADLARSRQLLANERGYDADKTLKQAAQEYLDAERNDSGFLSKIIDEWGDMAIRTITPEWVREHARDLYPNAKPQTLNRQVLTPLQAVLNFAFSKEDGRAFRIKRFQVEDKREKKAVDFDWHERFAVHAPTAGMAAMARFMFETGARISEACRVMPDHVDIDARRVFLPKTKTKPRLTIISAELADMIRPLLLLPALRNRKDKKKVNGVFGYASRHAVYNGWKRACEKAGISYEPPHSSGRVSFATETIVRQKIDPVTAARLGGWASPKLLLDTYAKAEGEDEIVQSIFGKPAKSGGHQLASDQSAASEAKLSNEINGLKATG